MKKDTLIFYLLNLTLIPLVVFCFFYLFKNDVSYVSQSRTALTYEQAENFCAESKGVLPNNNQLYDLAFYQKHKKTLYKYYWSSDKYQKFDNKNYLINMSTYAYAYDANHKKWGTFCVSDNEEGWIKYLALAFSIFVVGYIWYRFFKSKGLNSKYIDSILLGLLLIVWLVFALYKIGSSEAPETYFYSQNKSFEIDFGQSVEIDKVCHYSGIYYGHFTLSQKLESGYSKFYQNFTTGKHSFPYSFRWDCENVNIKTDKIKFDTLKSGLILGELKFFKNNTPITNFSISTPYSDLKERYTVEALFDEPNIPAVKNYYGGVYFDEIYHSRTGFEILHELPYYDRVHPMLGKTIIAGGIDIFGMNPIGYRSMNALFGTLMIIIFYFFVKSMFKSSLIGFLGGFLMTFEFMHLTQSRIGLIDTFGVFFTIVTLYMLLKFLQTISSKKSIKYLIALAVMFGLAVGVKWSSFFAISAIGFMILYTLFTEKYQNQKIYAPISGYKLILYSTLALGLSVLVYIATFIPMLLKGDSFIDIWNYQTHAYSYHSNLNATHSYSSPWWSWPIIFKPMGYVRENFGHDLKISITAFGNPAIWWFSIVAIFYTIYSFIRRQDINSLFIIVGICAMYLPYVLVDRIMFIYHFYYAVPIFMLAICYLFNDLVRFKAIKNPKYFYLLFGYMAVVATLFLVFYPVLSGVVIEKNYVSDFLIWFKNRWWL